MENTALILINFQNDYINNKNLEIIPNLNKIKDKYKVCIHCIYNHPVNHSTFKKCGGTQKDNCINSNIPLTITKSKCEYVIYMETKTMYISDSAFYDCKNANIETNLTNILQQYKIKNIHFCGLYDTTIYYTILDAIKRRYECILLSKLFINNNETNVIIQRLIKLGVEIS